MKELMNMDRPELLEVIRLKDALISELREEIEIYRELAEQLQEQLKNNKKEA